MTDIVAGPVVQKWLNAISTYDSKFQPWQQRVEKILLRYRDERQPSGVNGSRFNILWANVQTLIPATFSRLPQPDVSRRFRDNDPVGRVAALILERALDYEIQHYGDYRTSLVEALQDRFLGGRGTAWVRYEPHIERVEGPDSEPKDEGQGGVESAQGDKLPEAGLEVTEDSSATAEELTYECAPVDYVHWRDFGHTIARTWEEVTAVWRAVYMTRDALIERFGDDVGSKVPLDSKPQTTSSPQSADADEGYSRAKVYEIWDISSKTAIWISKSLGEVLDTRKPGKDDGDLPELEDFWPCPKPLYATLTNDSLIPVPDFTIYQDQQSTLDTLADRIDGLVRALAVKGVYDASQGAELARIFTEGENNSLLPMKNWAAFAEKNGLKGAIDLVDLGPIAAALQEAYAAMENVKGQVYELTGIADIIRGQGDAAETATAQALKGQYASLRLKAYQEQVAIFATEILRLKAQIICGKFDDRTLMAMAAVEQLEPEDQQAVPQALALLRSNLLRNFRVDIEADSLVQFDEQAEKQARVEFLQAVGNFMQQSMPMVEAAANQGAVPLVGLIFELLKFGVTGYKVGKTIEGKFDQALTQLQQLLAQPRPQKLDPAMAKVQAEQAGEQARMQADVQIEQAKLGFEQQKFQMTQAAANQKAQLDAQLEQFKAHVTAQQSAAQMAFDKWKAEADNETKIVVAELAAKTQIKTAAMSANASNDAMAGEQMSDTGESQSTPTLATLVEGINTSLGQLLELNGNMAKTHGALLEQMSKPKTVTLPDGRVAKLQ